MQAMEYLTTNPDKSKEICANINSRLLRMEHLSLEAAVSYLKAKKMRVAKGVSAFPAPPNTRKRNRPVAQDLGESGIGPYTTRIYLLIHID